MTTQSNFRRSEHPVSALFLDRWSPRAFTPEAIPPATLLTFLDAAHWAPSSYNHQPWRFLYARRDTHHWKTFLGLLNEFNQSWAKNAAVLLIVLSKKVAQAPGAATAQPNLTHAFDTGAAWGYLALQASLAGWQAHGMAGFDRDRTRSELSVPDDYEVLAAVAIGRVADKETLPENLRKRESPSDRLPLSTVAHEGPFAQE